MQKITRLHSKPSAGLKLQVKLEVSMGPNHDVSRVQDLPKPITRASHYTPLPAQPLTATI